MAIFNSYVSLPEGKCPFGWFMVILNLRDQQVPQRPET